MKKFLIFVLLCIPMTAFAASSVRVLGNKSVTPGSVSAVPATTSKVVPAKTTTTANKASGTTTSRVGTVRAKAKTVAPTVKGGSVTTPTAANTGSRFPVITPAHSYNSVSKPTTASNTSANASNAASESVDDPRFDMIRIDSGSPESRWAGNPLLQRRKNEGYVFMWIEE